MAFRKLFKRRLKKQVFQTRPSFNDEFVLSPTFGQKAKGHLKRNRLGYEFLGGLGAGFIGAKIGGYKKRKRQKKTRR